MTTINHHDELEEMVLANPAEMNARATLMILRLLRSIAVLLSLIAVALVVIGVEVGLS